MSGRLSHRHFRFIGAALVAGVTLAGCTVRLSPKEYALPAGSMPAVTGTEAVSVRAGQVDTQGRAMHVPPFDVAVNYQEFTDEAVRELKQELTKQGVRVAADAPRSIELTVMYVDTIRSAGSFACVIDYRVTTGDGAVRGLQAREWSWDFQTACNAAVALVSVETLRDASVRSYLMGPLALH
jgi:hypothetical protein